MFNTASPPFLDKYFTVLALEGGYQLISQTTGECDNWAE